MAEASSFVFDVSRCTGCGACRVACTIENRLSPTLSWRRIETFNPARQPSVPVFHLSMACNHCATAACMHACPTLAYRRDLQTRAVLLDSSRCIGCGYCSWACPYDAPVFDEAAGVMTKCTWCTDRLTAGLKPACVTHCPTGALDFAPVPPSARRRELVNAAAIQEGQPGRGVQAAKSGAVALADLGLQPSLDIRPLKAGRMMPEMAGHPGPDVGPAGEPAIDQPASDISLRHEWPLAVFTLGAALLVGVVTAAVAGMLRVPWWIFAGGAAAMMGIAGAHLGRPERGWRAVLNVRHSWLSREIVAAAAFTSAATCWLAGVVPGESAGWGVVALGFVALFAADRVYAVLPSGAGYRHSAGVVLSGLLFSALFAHRGNLALTVLAVKLLLYSRPGAVPSVPRWMPLLRIVLGMIVPLIAWNGGRLGHPAILVSIVIAETLDRCEYYMRLERRTPRRSFASSLAALVASQAHI